MELDIKKKIVNAALAIQNKPPEEPPKEITLVEKVKGQINDRFA